MTHCAGCGYPRAYHAVGSLRCPVVNSVGKQVGKWRTPAPRDETLWREIMRRDARARERAYVEANRPYVPETVLPPKVPARAPRDATELASYQGRQAVGLGRRAAAVGWKVAAYYWRAGDDHEGCAVKLRRDDLRAVATWKRAPGGAGKSSGWGTDVAYAWRLGDMPTKLNHTDLERLFDDAK